MTGSSEMRFGPWMMLQRPRVLFQQPKIKNKKSNSIESVNFHNIQ